MILQDNSFYMGMCDMCRIKSPIFDSECTCCNWIKKEWNIIHIKETGKYRHICKKCMEK